MYISDITAMPPIGVPTTPTVTTLTAPKVVERAPGQPTFMDVFSQIFNEAVNTDAVKNADSVRMVLGDVDDLETIMLNKEKATLALELFVNVRNAVVDSYNEIIRMQI
ncbi:MAG: flagellar hook-basal body complex protein FliE [Oscillospiraceae bacterium]|nr:flagellar hook-basal body complex protein FliE [Oscillospiraceae bacterium]